MMMAGAGDVTGNDAKLSTGNSTGWLLAFDIPTLMRSATAGTEGQPLWPGRHMAAQQRDPNPRIPGTNPFMPDPSDPSGRIYPHNPFRCFQNCTHPIDTGYGTPAAHCVHFSWNEPANPAHQIGPTEDGLRFTPYPTSLDRLQDLLRAAEVRPSRTLDKVIDLWTDFLKIHKEQHGTSDLPNHYDPAIHTMALNAYFGLIVRNQHRHHEPLTIANDHHWSTMAEYDKAALRLVYAMDGHQTNLDSVRDLQQVICDLLAMHTQGPPPPVSHSDETYVITLNDDHLQVRRRRGCSWSMREHHPNNIVYLKDWWRHRPCPQVPPNLPASTRQRYTPPLRWTAHRNMNGTLIRMFLANFVPVVHAATKIVSPTLPSTVSQPLSDLVTNAHTTKLPP
jgi:hypothetical protein